VTYFYTDYFVANAFYLRLMRETTAPKQKGKGREKNSRHETASNFLVNLANGRARDKIRLPLSLFVRAKSPDCLLALMNLHSNVDCYLPSDMILNAIEEWFQVNAQGDPPRDADLPTIRTIECHVRAIIALLDEPELSVFRTPPRKN
jgi:hypothetical protein